MVCSNLRPYPQSYRTLTLGCVNCGYPPFQHTDCCLECSGTGRGKDEKQMFDDNTACAVCHGSGRTDGFWNPL